MAFVFAVSLVARFKAININQLPLLVGEKKEDK
jgi:hypothetical protein